MHVLLTDALTCPRCGPEYGLILLAEDTRDRRIVRGSLGCANCRERYRVQEGTADLRYGAEPAEAGADPSAADALRIAAMLGVTEGPALLMIVGDGAVNAPGVVEVVPGIEIVAAGVRPVSGSGPGVSPVRVGARLPFRDRSMRGIALTGWAVEVIEEAARVVAARARVAVIGPHADTEERLERAGLRTIARDENAVVAERTLF